MKEGFKHPDDLVDVAVEGYDPFTVEAWKSEDITIVDRNGDKELTVIASGVKYKVKIVSIDFQAATYVLRINGKNFNCKARTHLHHLIGELGFNKASLNKLKDIHAPMPGLVLNINVKEGDEVKEGQNIMTLEAMKMENILKSPADGIISGIHTSVKSKVEKNELLISIE